MHRRDFLQAAALGVASPAPTAKAAPKPSTRLAGVVTEHARKTGFSGTVLVERGGEVLLHEGYALADRQHATPCRRDTRYRVASITKLFTSVMVMQLVDQGRLKLDDAIRDCLPAYKGEGAARVRVRHLLNHTSGIANMDTIGSFEQAQREGIPAFQLPHTSDQMLDLYASGRLVNEPGKAFDYNNADYIVLGKIIERAVGAPFHEALKARILAPLGMRSSGLLFQQDIVPRLAATYFKPPKGGLINDLPVYPENWYAAGGAYSDTADILRFAHGLYGGRLLQPASLRQLLTPGLDDYGFGLWVFDMKVKGKPHRVAQRPGRIMGANAAFLRFLDDDLTVIILANTNISDTDEFSFLIGRTVLGG